MFRKAIRNLLENILDIWGLEDSRDLPVFSIGLRGDGRVDLWVNGEHMGISKFVVSQEEFNKVADSIPLLFREVYLAARSKQN